MRLHLRTLFMLRFERSLGCCCYNQAVPLPRLASEARLKWYKHLRASSAIEIGQVAQVVERSPEKAGVGGSTPSLATIIINHLEKQPEISHL
jgi:hypothetical protein